MPTKIEWCDETWNPVSGCSPVSEACRNCYAAALAEGRMRRFFPNGFSEVRCHPGRLRIPGSWRKPRRVFVPSMGDLFHEDVPAKFVRDVWVAMMVAWRHSFLILTKRPERMAQWFADCNWGDPPLPNVWLGVTAENQEWADKRIPILLQTPAAKRFVSYEPALAPVDWKQYIQALDLVICGGETGPHARPMHLDWPRGARAWCHAAGKAFFLKSLGEWVPEEVVAGGDLGGDMRRGIVQQVCGDGREIDGLFRPGDCYMRRVGKRAAGVELDGKPWREMPDADL